jgi:hypothetical protein
MVDRGPVVTAFVVAAAEAMALNRRHFSADGRAVAVPPAGRVVAGGFAGDVADAIAATADC